MRAELVDLSSVIDLTCRLAKSLRMRFFFGTRAFLWKLLEIRARLFPLESTVNQIKFVVPTLINYFKCNIK